MKLFNAIQISALNVLGPLLIPLLKGADFTGAAAVMWILALVWLAMFLWTTSMIYDALCSD